MNTTVVADNGDENIIDRTLYDNIEIYVLSLCFIIGAPLNMISFYKLLHSYLSSQRKLRARRLSGGGAQINYLRIHLNIADLMILFIYTLTQIGWLSTTQWYGGNILCKIIKFFYTFVFYLTSFIIVCIAIDRVYGAYSISSLEVSKQAYTRCRHMIITAYILASVLSLPQLFIFGLVSPSNVPEFSQCSPIWMAIKFELQTQAYLPETTVEEKIQLWIDFNKISVWEKAYNICHLLFVFWIPALIIIFSYLYILRILNRLSGKQSRCRKCINFLCGAIYEKIFTKKTDRTASITSSAMEESMNEGMGIDSPKKALYVEITKTPRVSFADDCEKETIQSSARSGRDTRMRTDAKLGLIALHTIAVARQKTKRQAKFIVIAYLTLWTPYNLFAFINIFLPQEFRTSFLNSIMGLTPYLNCFIVINAIINPLIYGIFDKVYE